MTISSRYVKYSYTCPNGHTGVEEKMVFAQNAEDALAEITQQGFKCGSCKADSLTEKFRVDVFTNEPMPPVRPA